MHRTELEVKLNGLQEHMELKKSVYEQVKGSDKDRSISVSCWLGNPCPLQGGFPITREWAHRGTTEKEPKMMHQVAETVCSPLGLPQEDSPSLTSLTTEPCCTLITRQWELRPSISTNADCICGEKTSAAPMPPGLLT